MRRTIISAGAAALVATSLPLAAGSAAATVLSRVEGYTRAVAPGMSDEGSCCASQTGLVSGLYNQHSVNAVAEGRDSQGMLLRTEGHTQMRADYAAFAVNTSTSASTGQNFVNIAFGDVAYSSGMATAILQFDTLIEGTPGQTGFLTLSGQLWGGGGIDGNMLPGAALNASSQFVISASLWVQSGCSGAACSASSRLQGSLNGEANYAGLPYNKIDYTLQVPVKPGDHVYWNYLASVSSSAGYSAHASTSRPADAPPTLPRAAPAGDSFAAAAEVSPYSTLLTLSGGLSLADTEGLAVLGNGSYGFGAALVPEPAAAATLLLGLAALGALQWAAQLAAHSAVQRRRSAAAGGSRVR